MDRRRLRVLRVGVAFTLLEQLVGLAVLVHRDRYHLLLQPSRQSAVIVSRILPDL